MNNGPNSLLDAGWRPWQGGVMSAPTVYLAKTYRTVTVVTDHGAFSRTGVYRNTAVEAVLAGLQTWSERSGGQFVVYSIETA